MPGDASIVVVQAICVMHEYFTLLPTLWIALIQLCRFKLCNKKIKTASASKIKDECLSLMIIKITGIYSIPLIIYNNIQIIHMDMKYNVTLCSTSCLSPPKGSMECETVMVILYTNCKQQYMSLVFNEMYMLNTNNITSQWAVQAIYYIHPFSPVGKDYTITMIFKTAKGTGIGQIKMNFVTADGVPLNRVYLVDPQVPGSRVFKWDGTAAPDDDCDDKNCEQWIPGNYRIAVGRLMTLGVGRVGTVQERSWMF